jgi:hypothetical protein
MAPPCCIVMRLPLPIDAHLLVLDHLCRGNARAKGTPRTLCLCAAIEQTRRDANDAELAELRAQLRTSNVNSHKAVAVRTQSPLRHVLRMQ